MCGASILAAKASLVSGVGIQKNLVCDKNYTAFCVSVPEAVTVPCDTLPNGCLDVFESVLEREILSADSLLIGCGIGQTENAKELVYKALKTTKIPTVIDADGINLIAGDIELLKTIEAPVIITPHPKEMARLCGVSVTEIQNNRPEYAKKIAVKADCIVVLKGANTVVASPDGKVYFNTTGNSGMATGGSGDVLSGMISARLAMGETPISAALSCVYLHGLSGDMATKKYSMNGMLPTDMIKELKTM